MTKPVITTRAGKGSALTWTEGDTNLTNLRDATVTIKADTGGTDVVSDLNGTVTLVAGSNVTITGDNTAKTVTIAAAGASLALDDLTDVSASSPMSGDTLVWNNASSVWQAQAPSGGSMALDDLTDVNVMTASDGQVLTYNQSLVRWEATTPSSGGATTLDGLSDVVITAAATNDALIFDGTNWVDTALSGVTVGTASVGSTVTLTADNSTNATNYPLFANAATGNLSPRTDTGFTYNPSTQVLSTGQITLTQTGTNTGAMLAFPSAPYNATAWTTGGAAIRQFARTYTDTSTAAGTQAANYINALQAPTLAFNNAVTVTDAATLQVSAPTAGTNATLTNAWALLASGNIKTDAIAFKETREPLYDLGTTGGTIAPNVANGSVQKITLNSALTINAFTSPQAGQSLTLIIYGGTSYTSITSTMKFAGGIKTLTGTAGCIDILTVYYDGTNYFASLGKGFA